MLDFMPIGDSITVYLMMKGQNIMELNVNQKSVLKVLKDTYKKDTVTRSEINDLVKNKIKNPS